MTRLVPRNRPSETERISSKTNGNGHAHAHLPQYQLSKLPAKLRENGQFVLWKKLKGGKKFPVLATDTSTPAKSNDPQTWSDFKTAHIACVQGAGLFGVNAICSPDFTFVDIDKCVVDGKISARALQIMATLPETYWEYSPSRTGLHGIFRTTKKDSVRNMSKEQGEFECYSGAHFMSVTGWQLEGTPKTIAQLKADDVAPFRHKAIAKQEGTAAARDGKVCEGGRASYLTRQAGFYQRANKSLGEIEELLCQDNVAHCDPPLEEKRIQEILRSAAKWPSGDLLAQTMNDLGNAQRLLQFGEGNYRYIAEYKRWAVYDGTRWPVEDHKQEDVRAEAHRMLVTCLAQATQKDKVDEKAAKFAASCLNTNRISNLLREAQPYATAGVQDFDKDGLIINFRNGTFDVRTGKLREHRREDFISALIPYDYDPQAKCPRWERFIAETFKGDKGLVEFAQRALGYSVTGVTSEKCVFLAYGPTDTGKTTLLRIVCDLMPDYATSLRVQSLMHDRGRGLDNNALSDLADLRGKRFAMTSETEEGQRLREDILKRLSQGQGTYKAIRKYQNGIEFAETWKLWIDCNHLPRVRGTDNAIWNRLLVIPFTHFVAKAKQDKNFGPKLIAKEAQGILAWLVRGLMAWREIGLRQPEAVRREGDKWRNDSDDLQRWLDERCVLATTEKTASTDLYKNYCGWRESQKLGEISTPIFARDMEARGFEKKKVGSGEIVMWLNIALKQKERF